MLTSRWSSDAGTRPTTSDVVVDDDTHGLYLMARGLGPEVARTQAVQGAVAAAMSLLYRSIALDPWAPLDVLARLAVEDANSAVWRRRNLSKPDATVALSLLIVRNGRIAVGHVGHGRVLRCAGDMVVPLTVEHTVAHGFERLGVPAERLQTPGTLTRALGENMFVEVDVHDHVLAPDTTYVLLSSGFDEVDLPGDLWGMASARQSYRLPAKLIDVARSGGERERLSALVVHPVVRAAVSKASAATPRPSVQRRMTESFRRGVSRTFLRTP